MKRILAFFYTHPFLLLLLALPLTRLAQWRQASPVTLFLLACVGIVPLASYIGQATESLAAHSGPRLSALLNATLGNAAELIITIHAIQAGLLELVKASITGSIIGNLLLVLGLAMLVGGIRNGMQTFNRRNATRNAILLALAVVALTIPSLLSHSIGTEGSPKVEALSLGVAVVMLMLYGLSLLDAHRSEASAISHTLPESDLPPWTPPQALLILALATAGVVWLSEVLVHAAEAAMAGLGLSEFFLGIILVPLIGNVAEHLIAVQMAHKNQMDLSTEIAISSSLQIALLVAPLLVFISLGLGHPLQLVFNPFERLALLSGVVISALVSADGESTWLEGASLLAVYLIFGLAFFLLP